MAVQVRLFAALRATAGTSEVSVAPGPLPELLAGLRARYGAEFSRWLATSTVLVDGDAVLAGDRRMIPDGAEVALLPPVSGGRR